MLYNKLGTREGTVAMKPCETPIMLAKLRVVK